MHEIVAEKETRDEHGHFAKKPSLPDPSAMNSEPSTMNPVSKFLSEHTTYSKNQDDLLNIHIGNPLRKLVVLLEDIKRQKAFSFTLKGSLGLVGVVVALSLFGIFGGDKLLCSKGIQSQIGVIKVLNFKEIKEGSAIPFIGSLTDLFGSKAANSALQHRIVLIKKDDTAIKLENIKPEDVSKFSSLPIIATGEYDSCSQTLKITDSNGLQIYAK